MRVGENTRGWASFGNVIPLQAPSLDEHKQPSIPSDRLLARPAPAPTSCPLPDASAAPEPACISKLQDW